jgi:hypothetical protein
MTRMSLHLLAPWTVWNGGQTWVLLSDELQAAVLSETFGLACIQRSM